MHIMMFSTSAIRRKLAANVAKPMSKLNPSSFDKSGPVVGITVRAFANDSSFGATPTPYYSPTLTDKRPGEGGRGGRSSEADCKVAVFGGSGFLGRFLSAELGTALI
jgi:hypothetical protein